MKSHGVTLYPARGNEIQTLAIETSNDSPTDGCRLAVLPRVGECRSSAPRILAVLQSGGDGVGLIAHLHWLATHSMDLNRSVTHHPLDALSLTRDRSERGFAQELRWVGVFTL